MLFNSLIFLYLFLPITYIVFWYLRSRNQRYIWLTITGYAFYATWNYKFCVLMAFSTLVSYFAGLGFLRSRTPARRRLLLVLPIVADLLLLGFFKYANFFLRATGNLARLFDVQLSLPTLAIVLPVGISFYTFHTITYIVDSYRGVIRPTRNLFEFSCYVSLFSQLVAGPIVRFREIEKDLEGIDHSKRSENSEMGWSLFALGMIKKVLIADSLAAIVDPALARYHQLSTLTTWMCMLGYTYQIYFDFSGYSDMAVGLGLLFGLRLPQNFNSPYKAVSITDFWRRWHISLSTVLRDYLYIPLGGNRGGVAASYRNVIVTMLLGGLWHGANWTFVVWGAYHGALIIAQRLAGKSWERLPAWMARFVTFIAVTIGWVFFRSRGFSMATSLLRSMFVWKTGPWIPATLTLAGLLLLASLLAHRGPNTFEMDHRWALPGRIAITILFAACLVTIYGARSSPFLYFQF